MDLLTLLSGLSLMLIFVKAVTGKVSKNEVNCREEMQSLEVLGYNVNLTIFVNEDDYKNINIIPEQFHSYINRQRANNNFFFYGESTMFFRFKIHLTKICLHAFNLEIDFKSIKLVPSFGDLNNVSYTPKIHMYDSETQIVGLYFLDLPIPDSYTYRLIMKFVGSITDNTGAFVKKSYIDSKGEKTWVLAAANFKGAGARQIFPCWDEPNFRTNFTISVKYPINYLVLSNSPVDREFIVDGGMVWTHFQTTENISPHHVAVVLYRLTYSNDPKVWYRQDVKKELNFALQILNDTRRRMKHLFAMRVPSKVDHVIIPGFRDTGLESWGLILYGESDIIYDENLDFNTRKFEVALTVARKMIHHYVSNLVIQTWWSYLWLNEGIATFLAMEIVRETVHFHYTDLLTVQLLYEFFHLNDYYNMSLVSEIIEPSDIISPFPFTYYIKAPIFIYALVHTVTIYPFLQGLNAYLSMHKLRSIDSSNNTFDMFLNILQNDEISPELNINLTEKLSQWTTQERYTVLQVTRQKGNRTEIKLLQEYLNQSYSKNLWIPVTYTMQNSSEFEYKKWLSPQEPILHLTDVDSNQWIIVNVDRAGYHRVNYDYDNWQKLITCLHSETYYYISVRNRAQIIDDAYYFLLNNKLDFSLFKNLTNYLSNDINYAVWYPVFKIMEEISGVFPFQRSAEIKSHFQKILDSLLNKLEYSNKEGDNDFIKCLRHEAAKWACILRSSQCTATARFYLNWLYDQSRPIVPGWMEWIHCKGMMNADRSLWEKAMDASLTNKKLTKFLVCSENYVIIMDYIDRLKSEIYFTKAQDRIEVFHSIIARHAKKNVILDYILKHFTNIIYRDIKMLVALTDIINHLYSEDQLSKIYKYMQSTLSNKMSQKMSSYVLQKIKVRSLEIARCTLHFKNLLR